MGPFHAVSALCRWVDGVFFNHRFAVPMHNDHYHDTMSLCSNFTSYHDIVPMCKCDVSARTCTGGPFHNCPHFAILNRSSIASCTSCTLYNVYNNNST